jgi:hypothetical protein
MLHSLVYIDFGYIQLGIIQGMTKVDINKMRGRTKYI